MVAAAGDVIAVTFNYRLGIFGWLGGREVSSLAANWVADRPLYHTTPHPACKKGVYINTNVVHPARSANRFTANGNTMTGSGGGHDP